MFSAAKIGNFFLRSLAGILIGSIFGWAISDLGYFFTPNKTSPQRDPQRIELVIPYGTAEQVKAGVYNRSLPNDMTFIEGDILVVKNEDQVAHQLGPLFVPPQTSSVLALNTANTYTYECSFQPDKYIGLSVLPRVTTGTRLQAIMAVGLPTGMMLAVYSYLIPFKKKQPAAA